MAVAAFSTQLSTSLWAADEVTTEQARDYMRLRTPARGLRQVWQPGEQDRRAAQLEQSPRLAPASQCPRRRRL